MPNGGMDGASNDGMRAVRTGNRNECQPEGGGICKEDEGVFGKYWQQEEKFKYFNSKRKDTKRVKDKERWK